jgi:hypothetical protein
MVIRCVCILLCGLLIACSESADKRANVQPSQRDGANQRASAPVPRPSPDTGGPFCFQERGTLRVSEDSVGPLDLGMDLKRLRAVCPGARDTVDSERNATYPSVAFHFKGLTAVATQWEDSLLPGQPADAWVVLGENGLLYGRLPLTARWAAFRDALGTGISGGVSRDGRNVTVMFCAHPRAFLDFEFPDSMEDQSSDLSHIPSDARLRDVVLRANRTWNC